MPDPQLRPRLRQEGLKFLPRSLRNSRRLLAIRHGTQLEILGIVIEIAAQYDGPGFGKLHIKRLVPRCMAGCEYEHHRAVAEDVVLAFAHLRLAVLDSG